MRAASSLAPLAADTAPTASLLGYRSEPPGFNGFRCANAISEQGAGKV